MPRNGRGGRRQGKPGESYSNRTDLNAQPVRTTTGQEYGKAGAQQAAQQAVPLPTAPSGPAPGQLGFTDPTRRPDEPITAGLPLGPGPGAEALGMPMSPLEDMRAAYAKFPNEDLRALIEDMELRG